jgi:PST family polysaccharide transporter
MVQIRRVLNNRIAQNAVALYAVQMLSYAMPLITLPYLARVLEPSHLGLVAFSQSFAGWLSVVGEYGFGYSATRSIARVRERKEAVAGIVMSTMGAKALLTGGMILATLVAIPTLGVFRADPALAGWALLIAVAWTLMPAWYFQAMERTWFTALVDGITRIGQLAGIFLFVRSPQDAWIALAAQGLSSALSATIQLAVMYRNVPFRMPTLALAWVALKVSWNLFLNRASDNLYTSSGSLLLGMMTNPVQVAHFANGDKLVRPAISIIWPITQALYPRISHLMRHDADSAMRLSRVALMVTTGMGLAGMLLTILLAPWAVHLLFGHQYDATIPVLQVMSLLMPIVGFGASLSVQYMYPRRMEREVMHSTLTAGVIYVLAAVFLTRQYGALGMAVAVVLAETWASAYRFVVLRLRKVL